MSDNRNKDRDTLPPEENTTDLQNMEQASNQIDQLAAQGVVVDVDPDIADYMSAFEETALSTIDAEESISSVDPDTGVVISAEEEGAI